MGHFYEQEPDVLVWRAQKLNDETKEILIDLIGYYNVIGTEDDPGFVPFADIVHRASKALERHAKGTDTNKEDKKSTDIDPYELPTHKLEEEW